MTIRRSLVVILILAGTALRPSAAVPVQKGAPVGDVVRAVTEYVAAYGPKISGLTLQEEYTLLDVTGGRLSTTQTLDSDLVLLHVAGRLVALRDAYAIDSNALRPREPRITTLLVKPTPEGWVQAQMYAARSARYLKDDLIVRSNDPANALLFVAPENQGRVSWKIDGRKKMDGLEVIGLAFDEMKKKDAAPYLVPTNGNALASGRLWIDSATGRIHRTEFSLRSDNESAHVDVAYARDAALDLWLPKQMVDRYEIRESTGTNYTTRSYQGRADYSNPRLTRVNLTLTH